MRYYIIGNDGCVWGDASTRAGAESMLSTYDDAIIKEYELEIVTDET